MGWEAVIYVSTLAGIDRGLYEAAKIDGANRWQQILHVSLPGLATTFVKFSEIDKVFQNIVHPDPEIKKTVILFDEE